MRIILSRGGNPISRTIRWLTWGDWSHASLLTPDNTVIEAVWPRVRTLPFAEWVQGVAAKDFQIFTVQTTVAQTEDVIAFAHEQVGKHYDLAGDLHFLIRKNYAQEPDDRWFCSELVDRCFKEAGVELFARTEAWRVDPELLSRSILLTQ